MIHCILRQTEQRVKFANSQPQIIFTHYVLQVSTVLDVLGEASARAQGLKTAITSGARLRQTEGQTVYLLLDRQAAAGAGAVLGMLKVGRKKLFLLDHSGKPNELSPMCVLDFYVVER